MAEAIHCPSCSTRYRLRPERLRPAIRRAKCFTCGGLFPVGDIVQRLLELPAQSDTSRFRLADLKAAHEVHEDPVVAPPSLTLGDLEGVDEEILEKTLVDLPTSLPETKVEPLLEPLPSPEAVVPEAVVPEVMALPEPVAPVTPEPRAAAVAEAPTFPPEITEATLSGYTSARDAIDKLLGSVPAAPSGLKLQPESEGMDMEATLSVLDTTLSGTHAPTATDGPTDAGLTEEDLAGSSTSTMRLSQADLLAALATPTAPKLGPAPTVALQASDLLVLPESVSSNSPQASGLEGQESSHELLRLKIGEEIYGSLTMQQLTAWVEEGRILENHLVARQHSENWLEAHKVPGLRPVFERLRRERSGGAPSLDSGFGEIAPKKSLFGGLFGKA